MGCVLSKADTENLDFVTSRPSPSDTYTKNNQATSNQRIPKSYAIQIPPSRLRNGDANEDPPPYQSIAQNRSAELILEVLRQGLKLHNRDTINAFNNCKHRRLKVWIDDNPALETHTRLAIRLFALYLFLIGRGTMCDMEFLWMSHSNLESHKIGAEGRKKAKALNCLMKTDNWEAACEMINAKPELEDLGLGGWLDSQMGRNAGPQRHSTAEATNPSLNGENAQEKHARLLAHARDLMAPYFAGWGLKDVDMNRLVELDKEAVEEAHQQAKPRNNVSFTLKNEIKAYERETKRGGEGTPTTVILLVATPIVEAEMNSVIKCQRDTGFASKLSPDTVTGDMFCIVTMAFIGSMPQASVKRLQQIDDAFNGKHDINDLIKVEEKKLLGYGPTAKLFEKLLNSHIPSVDNVDMYTKDMYGKERLCNNGGKIVFPRIEDVERIFRKGDEDSDDDIGHAIRVPAAE